MGVENGKVHRVFGPVGLRGRFWVEAVDGGIFTDLGEPRRVWFLSLQVRGDGPGECNGVFVAKLGQFHGRLEKGDFWYSFANDVV